MNRRKTTAFCVLALLGLPGVAVAQRSTRQVTKSDPARSSQEIALYRMEGNTGFEPAIGISGGMPSAKAVASSDVGPLQMAAGLAFDTLWLTVTPRSSVGAGSGPGSDWDKLAGQHFLTDSRAHLYAGIGIAGPGVTGTAWDFEQLMDIEGFVREIALPRLDHAPITDIVTSAGGVTSAPDSAYCSVRIGLVPDKVQTSWNPKVVASNRLVASTGKACLTEAFTLAVGALPTASAVVEPLSLRRVTETSGSGRDVVSTAAVRMSPIHVRIASAEAAPWYNWYASFVIGGRNGRTDELPLRLAFPNGAVRIEADVGIVSFRPVVVDGRGFVDIELYGNLTKLQGSTVGASGAGAPPAAAPPAGAGNSTGGTNAPPPEVAGSFRVNLPTAVLTGTGSACSLAGGASAFVMQLDGPGGVGLIAGSGVRLRVGTFPVAVDGEGTVRIGFTQSGAAVVAYTAKSGTMTISKFGDRASGTFRVLADVTDVSNEAKEVEITGSFTNLSTSC